MNVHRPPYLTFHEAYVLQCLTPHSDLWERIRVIPNETMTPILLRAATIMYPESNWLRDLARPWFQYQIDLKRAEVAADNQPAPEGWKPRCWCGHAQSLHLKLAAGRCSQGTEIGRCPCSGYEPRDDT